jgi:hypothetical protein
MESAKIFSRVYRAEIFAQLVAFIKELKIWNASLPHCLNGI